MQIAWEGYGRDGQQTGVIDAPDIGAARTQLQADGYFPTSLKVAGGEARKSRKFSKTELMAVTSQLAVMIQSGVDLAEAVQTIAGHCTNVRLKQALTKVHQDLSDGKSITESIARQREVFGEAYTAGIAAGEATGNLGSVLQRLSELLKNEIRLKSTLVSVIAYPAVLISVASLVTVALMFFVLPRFGKIFEDTGTIPPITTQVLLAVSAALSEYWYLSVIGLVGIAIGGFWLVRTPRMKSIFDRLMLTTALIGPAMQSVISGRMFRMMGTLLSSGVPLLDCLRLCRNTTTNEPIRELFDRLEHDVTNGRGMGDVLRSTKLLPPAATQMVATAEANGKLASVLETVGSYFEEEGEKRLTQLAKFSEPALILFMAVIVAVVVSSIVLPLMDVSAGV